MTDAMQLAEDQELERLSPNATVLEAAKKMSANKVGSILIMDHDRLLGIFTERDLVNRVIAEGKDYKTTKIADVMSTELTTVSENESVTRCYEIMNQKHCRHLPIVNGDNKVIGVLSMRDLLDWRIKDVEFENKELKHYIMS